MPLRARDLLPGFDWQGAPEADAEARLRQFLAEAWGTRFHYMPAAMAAAPALLDADELAGLAGEPDADARLVGGSDESYWQEAGPFTADRFDQLGDRDWTLLVNGVDLHMPGFADLLRALRFVPAWRIDDAMVSFAAPGGSAGPHFDRYDVFLVQLQGTRRWLLGNRPDGPDRPRLAHPEMSLVAGFEPDHEILCKPGDVLYVPPGLVHHGIAETPCLTLSLGLRAPSSADLVSAWAVHCAEAAGELPVALDPALPARPARLERATVEKARALLRDSLLQTLDSPDFAHWLGTELTRPTRGMLLSPAEVPVTAAALQAAMDEGWQLVAAPGVRMLLIAEPDTAPILCVGGEIWSLPAGLDLDHLEAALDAVSWNAATTDSRLLLELAARLQEEGWLVLEELES